LSGSPGGIHADRARSDRAAAHRFTHGDLARAEHVLECITIGVCAAEQRRGEDGRTESYAHSRVLSRFVGECKKPSTVCLVVTVARPLHDTLA
jgi:hypothetical protein